jgi:hypothetical protein
MRDKKDHFTGDLFKSLSIPSDALLAVKGPAPPQSSALTDAERSRRYRQQKKLRAQQISLF